jgi:hypothetical protein
MLKTRARSAERAELSVEIFTGAHRLEQGAVLCSDKEAGGSCCCSTDETEDRTGELAADFRGSERRAEEVGATWERPHGRR